MPWERRRYRKNKAWLRVDSHGKPLLDERGLAPLRFKPTDERTYSVRPDDVAEIEAEHPEPDAQAEGGGTRDAATEDPSTIQLHVHGVATGNPGPGGLGVVLCWQGRRREIQRYVVEATEQEAQLLALLAALGAVRKPSLPVAIHAEASYLSEVLDPEYHPRADLALVEALRRERRRFDVLRFVPVQPESGGPDSLRAVRLAIDAMRSSGTA